jgi:hypothetical protein
MQNLPAGGGFLRQATPSVLRSVFGRAYRVTVGAPYSDQKGRRRLAGSPQLSCQTEDAIGSASQAEKGNKT